jgi:hypothetical protein
VINWRKLSGGEGWGFLGSIQEWLVAILVYPGLLFGLAVALAAEWLTATISPRLAPSAFRPETRPNHPLQPLHSFGQLARRRAPESLVPHPDEEGAISHDGLLYLSLAGAVAPVLALALIPLGGNPVRLGDALTVIGLLAVQPVIRAAERLMGGGAPLEGTRILGRLVTGLATVLLVVAALVLVGGQDSLALEALGAAPETGWQFLVRLLGAAALLAALPWWVDQEGQGERAGSLLGRHLQTAALGAFWAVLILPRAGAAPWAFIIAVLGTLFAAVAIRLVPVVWAPLRAEREKARLVWAGALPLAALAAIISVYAAL